MTEQIVIIIDCPDCDGQGEYPNRPFQFYCTQIAPDHPDHWPKHLACSNNCPGWAECQKGEVITCEKCHGAGFWKYTNETHRIKITRQETLHYTMGAIR